MVRFDYKLIDEGTHYQRELPCGKWTLIDKVDQVNLKDAYFNWCHNAVRVRECRSLGAMILNLNQDVVVDHINGNPLDNRRSNLRAATKAQNSQNQGVRKGNTSGYKGVSFHKQRQSWCAYIMYNRKSKWLGLFNTKEEAALAYNEAALKYHGEFAKLNKIV